MSYIIILLGNEKETNYYLAHTDKTRKKQTQMSVCCLTSCVLLARPRQRRLQELARAEVQEESDPQGARSNCLG